MIKGLNGKVAALQALCLSLAFFFISGCITTEAEKNRMQYQINTLETEVKNIKQKSKSIETQFPGQQKQFSELVDTQRAAAKTTSDLLIRIQYLTTEVQMITGRFDEARYHSEKNSAELKENKEMLLAKMKQIEIMVEDLKKRLAADETAEAPPEEPGKTITGVAEKEETQKTGEAAGHKEDDKEVKKTDVPEAVKDKAEQEDKTDVKDIYMAAYEAYKEDRTVEAREMFRTLLADYPENEYSDNASFWIAESYYKDGNFEDAILGYEEFSKKYPDSDKVPGAMLKQGLAFYALEDSKTGKIILERLVDKYPESEPAKLAIKKMKKAKVQPKEKK